MTSRQTIVSATLDKLAQIAFTFCGGKTLRALHAQKIEIVGTVHELHTGSGDVYISGTAGNITTASGDVSTGSITGNVSTTSGDVNCKGPITGNIKTVSGDIAVKRW